MMRKRITGSRVCTLALCFLTLNCSFADVFTLWPFSNKSNKASGYSETANQEVEIAKRLIDEPIIVNGQKTSLGIGLINRPFLECVIQLKQTLKKTPYASGPNTLVYQLPGRNGRIKRILLINAGGKFPVIQFSLEIDPNTLKRDYHGQHDLPLPGGAVIKSYFAFPKRHSSYAQFEPFATARQTTSEINMQLRAAGWLTPSTSNNNGNFYYKTNPAQCLIFNIIDTPNGRSQGTIYKKQLKK